MHTCMVELHICLFSEAVIMPIAVMNIKYMYEM